MIKFRKPKIQLELSELDKSAFQKISEKLISNGWSTDGKSTYFDEDWGWIILADKTSSNLGVILRRLKPFRLDSLKDFERALKVQERLRSQLVEVIPYKIFLGNKICIRTVVGGFNFLSEADFPFWSKFFKTRKFSLEKLAIGEAKNSTDDQLYSL